MKNEGSPQKAPDDHFDQMVDKIGADGVADIVGSFGLPPEGSPEEAAMRARFAAEDSLEARATAPDTDADVVDIRDGFDTQRTEGLEPNDPITEATIAASNGDTSLLEALSPEDRNVADMLMISSADTGERPADIAARLADLHDDGQLPVQDPDRQDPAA